MQFEFIPAGVVLSSLTVAIRVLAISPAELVMKQRYSAPLLSAVISTRRVLEIASLPVKYSKELAPGARHSHWKVNPSPPASTIRVAILLGLL